jgi:hypothetical protein
MEESVKLMVVLGVVGLLVLVAACRFISQRRQLSSGRIIGRFFPQRLDGMLLFETRMTVTTGGKWCRVLLALKSAEAHSMQYSPGYFFEKVAFLVGTPYTLTLRNPLNQVVHTERRSLEPFVAWLGSRDSSAETLLGEHSAGSHQGTVTLIEFLPREVGEYSLSLHLSEKVESGYPGFSSRWEMLEAELVAMEDVIPLSETVSYPHYRVRVQ